MGSGEDSIEPVLSDLRNLSLGEEAVGKSAPAKDESVQPSTAEATVPDSWDDDDWDERDFSIPVVPPPPEAHSAPSPAKSKPKLLPAAQPAPVPAPLPSEALAFEGAHLVELYGLSASNCATHLKAIAEGLGCAIQPTVLRVDDSKALLVCSDPKVARAALLKLGGDPSLCARGWSSASAAARKLPARQLRPPAGARQTRPATNASVARRLIGNALNLDLRDRDGERALEEERARSRTAREANRTAKKEVGET